MTSTIEELIAKVCSYHAKADTQMLKKAYDLAEKAHHGQKRKSGLDFITHPLEVSFILAELRLDVVTITAGLLHDVVEDTSVKLADIEREFGSEVAALVDGVTKLNRIEYKTKEEQQVENLRKMFMAMAKDIRVILIKLADRLHNMRTLSYQSPQKQKETAEETLEIFAPVAHRLGIFRVKWQLEDLALKYLYPESYYDIVEKISMKRLEREEYISKVIDEIKPKLEEMEIKADISGRSKHFYSIYNKMVRQGKELNEIYDLIAVRIIVDNIKDCYAVLGVVHTMWKPIPGRFKDYIAMPKPNMYQSLHTTVIGPNGDPFEIQIRTWEMHRTSEYGIAAHWRYKEGKASGDEDFNEKLSWLRQLLEWQQEMRDAREFMESLKIDLFSDRVYVFTPKGDVVELPFGSVPIDFAYKVHTAVGHQCVGAKVNGRIVPLEYKLQTGEIVEVITQKGSGPSRDWLNIVQTSQAKNRIRSWFKKEKREEDQLKGKELLEKEVRKQGLEPAILKPQRLLAACKRSSITSTEELYVAVSNGVITANQVINRIKEEFLLNGDNLKEQQLNVKPWTDFGSSSHGVRIKGVDNIEVRMARCCNPLPGDEITGYITRGKGVTVHRCDCPNIQNSEKERLIDVSWDISSEEVYQVHLVVTAMDRARLALDIMNAIAETNTNVNAINARATKNHMAAVDLKVEIRSAEHLEYIAKKINKIRDVLEVKRMTPKAH